MVDLLDRLSRPDLPGHLQRLGFRDEDAADLFRVLPGLLADPGARRRVAYLADQLQGGIGRFAPVVDVFGRSDPADDRWGTGVLAMVALLLSAPQVVAFHARRRVAGDISWRSLADLGEQVAVHRLTYAEFGLHTQGWLCTVWSGGFFWLGRLQFNLHREGGDWVLSTHIPRTGPLRPDLVDQSFAQAARFFAEHFADYPTSDFFCDSWLLDPALAAGLPGSNIAAFQQRWRLVGDPVPGDGDALFFTFHRRGGPGRVDLAALPQDTALQRVIVDRLRSGGHWKVWRGRFPQAQVSPGSGVRGGQQPATYDQQ